MARVIDYAWARPGVQVLRQAGAVAVCRYLSWLPNGKCLSRSEADTLRAGGIDIVSNWEYFGDWANDYSGGRTNGRIHAMEAARQHTTCGGPAGRPIYFSTDFNPTAAQLPTIADYYRGVAEVIGLDRTGAYGGYATIKYLFDAGVIRWGWQTYAWSNGRWDTRAQLRQVQNGVQLAGQFDVDLNDTQAADYGQWGYQATPSPRGETMLLLARDGTGQLWIGDGVIRRRITEADVGDIKFLSRIGALGPLYKNGEQIWENVPPAMGVDMATVGGTTGPIDLSEEALERLADAVTARPDTPLGPDDAPVIRQAFREEFVNIIGQLAVGGPVTAPPAGNPGPEGRRDMPEGDR